MRRKNTGLYETFTPDLGVTMARTKPYTFKLALLDVFLTMITGGGWLLIVLVRELYRRK